MSHINSEILHRARRARVRLATQFLDHPGVILVDIGYMYKDGRRTDQIALRIHVRERWIKTDPENQDVFPEQLDGIPIVVMPGDYRLETDAPAATKK